MSALDERGMYFDKAGQPITFDRWGELYQDWDYRQVARTETDEFMVSTVWLGLNHSFTGGPPVIFEWMVFGGPLDEEQRRYVTEAQAVAGHDQLVAEARGLGTRRSAL